MDKIGVGIYLELEFDNEETPPLIELIDAGNNNVREQEQQMLAVWIQYVTSNTREYISNIPKRELQTQRMVKTRMFITN